MGFMYIFTHAYILAYFAFFYRRRAAGYLPQGNEKISGEVQARAGLRERQQQREHAGGRGVPRVAGVAQY